MAHERAARPQPGVFEADGHTRRYNSALLLDRDGKAVGRYDKIHRVPFGEYVPLRDVVPA